MGSLSFWLPRNIDRSSYVTHDWKFLRALRNASVCTYLLDDFAFCSGSAEGCSSTALGCKAQTGVLLEFSGAYGRRNFKDALVVGPEVAVVMAKTQSLQLSLVFLAQAW